MCGMFFAMAPEFIWIFATTWGYAPTSAPGWGGPGSLLPTSLFTGLILYYVVSGSASAKSAGTSASFYTPVPCFIYGSSCFALFRWNSRVYYPLGFLDFSLFLPYPVFGDFCATTRGGYCLTFFWGLRPASGAWPVFGPCCLVLAISR